MNLTGTLNNTGSTLVLNAVTGSWNLAGGTITGGTLSESDGAELVMTSSGGTLDGVTVNGDLDLQTNWGATVTVLDGLVLNGTMYLGKAGGGTYGSVFFGSPSLAAGSLSGTGTVVFGASGSNSLINESNLSGADGTLTIGSGITIRGQSGEIINNTANGQIINEGTISADTAYGEIRIFSGPFTNQGTISADTVGGAISIYGPFTNQGTVQVAGGTLNLNGTWTNATTIVATTGTVNLGGQFTSPGLLDFTGATVNLTGTLNNTGSTLVLNAVTGSWNLAGGTITGGTLSESDGAELVMTSSGGTLDGVTVNGDLDLQTNWGATVTVLDGLVLNGTMYLGKAGGGTYGSVFFGSPSLAAGSLSGTGTVVFGASGSNSLINESNLSGADGTLTIGSGITIRGQSGEIIDNTANGQIINEGTISADTAYGEIRIFSGPFTNQGTISADTVGGAISIYGPFTNQGTVQVAGGTLNLNGTWTNATTIVATTGTVNLGGQFTSPGLLDFTGATVNLTGTLNNTGSTLVLNAVTGSWNLAGGTITGGTLSESDGAELVMTSSGGTLDGVTVNGDLDLQTNWGATVTVLDGLVLNGTMYLGKAGGGTYGSVFFGSPSLAAGSLSGTGTVVFGAWGSNSLINESNLSGADGTLTIGSGITIRGQSGEIINNTANGQIINEGTISADTAYGEINDL